MLVISKQNFSSEPCYSCSTHPDEKSERRYSMRIKLYHKKAYQSGCDVVEVCVPHCGTCMEKMEIQIAAIFKIAAICGAVIFLSRVFFDSFLESLCYGLFVGIIGSGILYFLLELANSMIYKHIGENYEIVRLLIDKYGWQIKKPKSSEVDKSYTKEFVDDMCYDLIQNHGCKIEKYK